MNATGGWLIPVCFAPDDGAGGGAGAGATTPPAGAGTGDAGGNGGAGSGTDDGRVPRSVLLDERNRRKAIEDELAQIKETLKQHEDGQKSELQKAQERVAKLERERDSLKGTLTVRDKSDVFKRVASEVGVRPDALDAAVKLVDLSSFANAEEAKVVATECLTAYPFLKADGTPPRMGTTGAGSGVTPPGSSTTPAGGGKNTDDSGQITDHFRRGFGSWLLGVAGQGRAEEGAGQQQ